MRIVAGCLGFLAVVALAPRARAQDIPALSLSVERGSGSEACPDETELAARIEQIRGRHSGGTTAYHVAFAREQPGLSATISSGDDATSARVLKTEDATCAALGQAVAVTLALLIDAAAPPPTPPKPGPPPRPKQLPLAPSPVRERSNVAGVIGIGATALIAVVRPAAPVFSLELGTRVAAFRASLGVAWMPPQDLELAPGSVHETLAAGTARLCLAPLRGRTLRFDVCAGVWLGLRSATGHGYTENSENHSTWLGVPLELSLAQLTSPFGWETSLGALLSVPRRHYTVAGVGSAYDAPAVGFVLSARGLAVWPW